ncbi:MAG: hemolysin family protein [Thermodesulfobacteriota bacterium]
MSLEFVVVVIALCLVLQAFFAGSEIALVSCDKIKIKALSEKGSKRAVLLMRSFHEIEHFISTTLVGINLSLIVSTVVLTFFIQDRYGAGSEFYTILILSPLIVVFGQVVPKAVFHKHSNPMALASIYPLWVASKLFFPVLFLVRKFTSAVLNLIGSTENPFITREELRLAIQQEGTKPNPRKQELIMKRIFDFSETRADEIMIPLINVTAVSEDTSARDAIGIIKQTGHTRMPIYHDRVDNITGMLHAFYLLGAEPKAPVKNFSRKPMYVPESMGVDELLDFMKKSTAGMAVVVDEYGGAVGAVTIEDILEEVVGEIEDEYDKGVKLWRKISENQFLVNPGIEIDMLNEELRLNIPEGDYETLSGFVLSRFGSIPNVGDTIQYENKKFTVTKASPRTIEELKVVVGKKSSRG